MDMKEKQIIVTLTATFLILGLYSLYIYNRFIEVDPEIINSFKFWGKAFLILIPIAIVAQIIIHIVFAIINKMVTNEDIPYMDDERDKLIELKSTKISHWIFTFGFLLAMGSQAIDMKPWVMFVTLFSSGVVSGIVSELARFYFYRKGV
jgi:cell division protein FtsL